MADKQSILIVDDEVDFLSSMRRLLRKEPYNVLTSDSGRAALETLAKKEISIVLSDYMMPGINGLALLRQVRAKYPNTITMMLTALSEIEIAMKAINEAGVYKFFLKPVDFQDLKITLAGIFEHRDAIREQIALRRTINEKSDTLKRLENKHPGITQVERDKDGYYILKE